MKFHHHVVSFNWSPSSIIGPFVLMRAASFPSLTLIVLSCMLETLQIACENLSNVGSCSRRKPALGRDSFETLRTRRRLEFWREQMCRMGLLCSSLSGVSSRSYCWCRLSASILVSLYAPPTSLPLSDLLRNKCCQPDMAVQLGKSSESFSHFSDLHPTFSLWAWYWM